LHNTAAGRHASSNHNLKEGRNSRQEFYAAPIYNKRMMPYHPSLWVMEVTSERAELNLKQKVLRPYNELLHAMSAQALRVQ
jgi:hypothetical protein